MLSVAVMGRGRPWPGPILFSGCNFGFRPADLRQSSECGIIVRSARTVTASRIYLTQRACLKVLLFDTAQCAAPYGTDMVYRT